MRIFVLLLLLSSIVVPGLSQTKAVKAIGRSIQEKDIRAELEYLASDEMRGRDTGSPEIDQAADWIVKQFKGYGLSTLPGADGYFQPVKLERIVPARSGWVSIDTLNLKLGTDWLLLTGESQPVTEVNGDLVFLGYGTESDFAGKDLKGKVALTWVGTEGENEVFKAFSSDATRKRELAMKAGASGIIEMYNLSGMNWSVVASFGGRSRITLATDSKAITHIVMKKPEPQAVASLQSVSVQTNLHYEGYGRVPVPAKNVAAVLPGRDKKLKDEYVVLSAHYDHVGVRKSPNSPDSIYNGARDNAIGTVALVEAARYFSKSKPARSLIFLALTAEEQGLLGSNWYASHPLVDLKKTVFNLNCDGAGYNDTTLFNIIGLEKTTAEQDFVRSGEPFGLKVIGDPVPEQNLYRRSDNYNFARLGVPAVNFSTGLTAFDAEINKYYHKPADETSSLNFRYLVRYYSSLLNAWSAVINAPMAPFWKPGDSQEEAGKKLYGRE